MSITLIFSLSIIFIYCVLFIFAMKTKMYNLARYIHPCLLPIPVYFIIFDLIFNDISKFAKMFPKITFVSLVALFIYTVCSVLKEFWQLHKYQKNTSGFVRYELIFIAARMTVSIIVLFAMLYLLIFSMFPSQYAIDNTLPDYELAFEFLYYSFNVTITYSNSGIEATGVIAKLLQMTHIAVFYFYAAGVIFKLLADSEKR